MKEKDSDVFCYYNLALEKAIRKLTYWYAQYCPNETELRDRLWRNYRENSLDPDGKAIRKMANIDCSADGLHSIYRICCMEQNIENIIPAYAKYRKRPIFFFPCEQGGINQTRSRVFGDRIDYTLYDLSLYFTRPEACRLTSAYKRPLTKEWLDNMKSFHNIVDEYRVKGIFTDNQYQVYNIETEEKIEGFMKKEDFSKGWSQSYYANLKKKIVMWYEREGVIS